MNGTRCATSRGAVVDTRAVIRGLKDSTIGGLGLDVYEEEADLFFEDRSDRFILEDIFARLLTFPNVLVTGHQAFFTTEALQSIAETTVANITAFAASGRPVHEVSANNHITTDPDLRDRCAALLALASIGLVFPL
jgi:D-lactate dehydrogenase